MELNAKGTGFWNRQLDGEYEYSGHRWSFDADWGNDIWGVHSAVYYVGEFEHQPDLDFDGVLDEEPPFAVGDGDGDLYGYVSSQHNPRGQFAYGKVTYKF